MVYRGGVACWASQNALAEDYEHCGVQESCKANDYRDHLRVRCTGENSSIKVQLYIHHKNKWRHRFTSYCLALAYMVGFQLFGKNNAEISTSKVLPQLALPFSVFSFSLVLAIHPDIPMPPLRVTARYLCTLHRMLSLIEK